jgi:hypothetical protein
VAKKSLSPKKWSLLAYIAGDNNLSDAGLEDISEMCVVGSSPGTHCAVQIDTAGEFDGVVRYEISEPDPTGVAHRVVIERLPEEDSGAVETLRDFLKWGLGRYPAEKRLVVVWNHGAGFRTRLPRRDIAFDDLSGNALDMNEVDAAFERAGVDRTNRLDIIGFDACLMNMIEIAHHLRDRVKVVVGSEQTEPGDGWPYDDVLKLLNANKSVEQTAKGIVQAYIKFYRKTGESDVTQSAVRTDATDPAMAALSKLGDALAAALAAELSTVRLLRKAVQAYEYADYVDLIHLCRLLVESARTKNVKARARAVISAAKKAIIANDRDGKGVGNSSGLSVWFPADPSIYSEFRAKYTSLAFYQWHRGWVDFLDRYHSV